MNPVSTYSNYMLLHLFIYFNNFRKFAEGNLSALTEVKTTGLAGGLL